MSKPASPATTAGIDAPHLRRTLGLGALIFTGIVMIQPTAPMPLFGVVSQKAGGHVVTTVLIAMVAMLFTALGYGRMARAYPSAGSAYTYVSREIHPGLGFATGWSMMMDYMLNPIICTIWCSEAAGNVVRAIPYPLWVVFFALLFTLLNLRGVQATARTNVILTLVMGAVIVAMMVATIRYVLGLPQWLPGFFTRPFYDPATFSLSRVSTGTATAVLTYIGFDGISTLSEEVHNPRRNILLATVLVCLIIGVLSGVEVYAAQLVWPAGEPFPNEVTAYVDAAGRAGGPWLYQIVNLTLLVATIGSGSGAMMAGARLLYGMGRDRTIPRGFFAYIDPRTRIPRNNVLLMGLLCLVAPIVLTYGLGADLLNFGALIGFMGVNVSSLLHYWVRVERKQWTHLVPPVLGFLICLYIWVSLERTAMMWGAGWLTVGLIYGYWRTGGFRRNMMTMDEGTSGEPEDAE
jgi:putrescine importer